MLTLTRLPAPPTMLLIENPEQGLYPPWLGDVLGPLKEAASRPFSQVIVSTHSPAVLNFFRPEEVTLLVRPAARPDGPPIARSLQSLETVRRRMASRKVKLGELWREFEG